MWLSRITSELRSIPPVAYWISGLAATAVVSAVLASSFQQSLSEIRLNSTLSREIALRENYESEIRDLKFQLGELRGRMDQDASGLSAPARKQQELLLRQFREIEALVTLAEQSNLVLSAIPPSPKRKPLKSTTTAAPTASLSYAPQQNSSAPLDILGTLSGKKNSTEQHAATHKDFYSKQAQGQLLLTAYTQAALDDIKRANTLLKKAGVSQPAFVTPRSSAGGIYQDIGTADLDSSMIAARRIIEQRIELNAKVDALPFGRPLNSFNISSPYGARTDPFLGKPAIHTGLDFKASRGTPVKATGAGIVSLSRYNGGYGLSVEIVHDNGLITRYAHMQKLLVSEGQRVNMGDLVGTVGNTGRSTGPHLHYEVRLNGKPINPMRFIRTGDRLAAIFHPKQQTKVALNLP
ncbi:M23 family metallopeptidase [Pseudovibrio brasiliensis]|uniref:M23 family metallopeptidase n=2 Tax=Pseudovibrio brasiliensis TaxID=1898042 RepID=A0ABX8AGH2_9HYPH|nr:M23 family metallopeptidase [Pseudovibrio brasiliensis]QUS54168.1 M23 family metallopeptidase [Pseudovibrio brasiliensis]